LIDRTQQLGGPFEQISSFGEDAEGELYFSLLKGRVYKIVKK